ncbi:MAG: hypothetical protein PHY59_03685 [Methanobacterium sp.]|nr:hypothetical protein [Methanobacterium sp.]
MGLNKIISIMAIIIISGVFLTGIQAVSAAHTTEIKAYTIDPLHFPGKLINSVVNIKEGKPFNVVTSLHVDGGKPLWFRSIGFTVIDFQGKVMFNTVSNTIAGGYAYFFTNSEKWDSGKYIVMVYYLGSETEDYPMAYNVFMLCIK